MTYKIGQRFRYTGGSFDESYILAQVGYKQVALIGLDAGNRWMDPVKVEHVDEITEAEFDAIRWGGPEDFELINAN